MQPFRPRRVGVTIRDKGAVSVGDGLSIASTPSAKRTPLLGSIMGEASGQLNLRYCKGSLTRDHQGR